MNLLQLLAGLLSLIVSALGFVGIFFTSSCSDIKHRFEKDVKPSTEIECKTYDTKNFISMTAAFPMVVTYEVGDGYKVMAEGPKNVMDELKVRSKHGLLEIEIPNGDRFTYSSQNEMIRVYITAPHLTNIQTMAGAIINLPKSIRLPKETLNLSALSKGIIYADSIYVQRINMESMASSKIEVKHLYSHIMNATAVVSSVITVGGRTKVANIESNFATIDTSYLESEVINIEE